MLIYHHSDYTPSHGDAFHSSDSSKVRLHLSYEDLTLQYLPKMTNDLAGKRKKELGFDDNKAIPISSILGIKIKLFRTLKDQTLHLGENLTILSGRNGTMKTSLMGLLAHPFSSEAKDAFGNDLKTSIFEIFKLSSEYDDKTYSYEMVLLTKDNKVLCEPVSFYYVGGSTQRHRIVVSGAEKGDGNFSYNTSFLNLKRLFPLVSTQAAPSTDSTINLSKSESADLKDFYETVFPSSEYDAFVPVHEQKIKTTFALTGTTATYNWQTISSGEDNLGSIFNRLIGFQRAFSKNQKFGNGILCIDEFESSLHPIAQLQLLDYLYRWSERFKVQVVISTHSLHLIQHLYLKHSPNLKSGRITLNFISKSTASEKNFPILKNPSYDLAYKELTLANPVEVASARKVKILCEDEMAVHYAKRLIKSQNVLKAVEFHSSLDPTQGKVGTSWCGLRTLCVQYPLLLEGALALFDADVEKTALDKIKNTDLYMLLPDKDSIAIERRIIVFILSLPNDDNFFKKFNKERESFLADFKAASIKSLSISDIMDDQKTSIERCKVWAGQDRAKFKQYVTYYCDDEQVKGNFREQFIARINKINAKIGLPKIT